MKGEKKEENKNKHIKKLCNALYSFIKHNTMKVNAYIHMYDTVL